jgi:hypothetical protein
LRTDLRRLAERALASYRGDGGPMPADSAELDHLVAFVEARL